MKPSTLLAAWRETYPQTVDNNDSIRLPYAVLHFLDGLRKDVPPTNLIGHSVAFERELFALERITSPSASGGTAEKPKPSADGPLPFRIWSGNADALISAEEIRSRFETAFGEPGLCRPAEPPTDLGTVTAQLQTGLRLIEETTGELGATLVDQIDQVVFVTGNKPFLAGTSLGIPRTIFLNPSLLDNEARLAEHILHEAVHTALYKSYFERTPLRRFSAARAEYGYISAVWHDPDLDNPDDPWWWGAEKAFHAFTVYVHLAHFHLGLLRRGGHDDIARSGLQTALFCGHFLGSRLVHDLADLFVGDVQRFIKTLFDTLPVTAGVQEAAAKYENKGVRRTSRQVEQKRLEVPQRYAAGFLDDEENRLFVMTEETAFVLTGEWAQALAGRDRGQAFRMALHYVQNGAVAARPVDPDLQRLIDRCVEVDGVTLRHMAFS